MDLPVNAFKQALKQGRRQIGLWTALCSGLSAEILGAAGYDWILIDAEHAPNELSNVLEQLRALKGGTATPIVRPAWNDPVLMKRYLDIGVQSFLVPWVQNAQEAARAVAATRYPPAGIRGVAIGHRASGFGKITDYLKRAHEQICVLVQVETKEALDELEAIAAVDGVDGIFIGPSDLAAAMGRIGGNREPDIQAIFVDACSRAKKVGKPIGILAPVEEDARKYVDAGFDYVALGSDAGLLRAAAEQLRARFLLPER